MPARRAVEGRCLDHGSVERAVLAVSGDPTSNGALLNVTINNIPLTDNAEAKGFMTGFTLGLVGTRR